MKTISDGPGKVLHQNPLYLIPRIKNKSVFSKGLIVNIFRILLNPFSLKIFILKFVWQL